MIDERIAMQLLSVMRLAMPRLSHLWQCTDLLFAVLKGDDPAELDDPLWEFTVDHTPSVHMIV